MGKKGTTLVGQVINDLEVLDSYSKRIISKNGKRYYKTIAIVKCINCNKTQERELSDIKRAHARCECSYKYKREMHGKRNTRLYKIYVNMIDRTEKENSTSYKNYGARGIKVCAEWKESFKAFYNWAMANGYSDEFSIDRIDNDKGYSPDNCRWSDRKTQSLNRRTNHILEYNGECKTIEEWSTIVGIEYGTLWNRINLGWDVSRALTEPIRETERLYTCNGRALTLKEWGKEVGISYRTLSSRINNYKWPIEKALTEPIDNTVCKEKLYTFDGQSLTLRQWAKKMGMEYGTLAARIYKSKWSLEKALATPVNHNLSRTTKK